MKGPGLGAYYTEKDRGWTYTRTESDIKDWVFSTQELMSRRIFKLSISEGQRGYRLCGWRKSHAPVLRERFLGGDTRHSSTTRNCPSVEKGVTSRVETISAFASFCQGLID